MVTYDLPMQTTQQEFKVTVLPDDPRLSPEATRRRNVRNSKAWKSRGGTGFSPRSLTKQHQHHLITDAPVMSSRVYGGLR